MMVEVGHTGETATRRWRGCFCWRPGTSASLRSKTNKETAPYAPGAWHVLLDSPGRGVHVEQAASSRLGWV